MTSGGFSIVTIPRSPAEASTSGIFGLGVPASPYNVDPLLFIEASYLDGLTAADLAVEPDVPTAREIRAHVNAGRAGQSLESIRLSQFGMAGGKPVESREEWERLVRAHMEASPVFAPEVDRLAPPQRLFGDRRGLPPRRFADTFGVEVVDGNGVTHRYLATIGRSPVDETVLEVFLNSSMKQGTFADVNAADAALAASLALQYGCPLDVLRKGMKRNADGVPQGPLGAALDAVENPPAGPPVEDRRSKVRRVVDAVIAELKS